MLYTGASAKCRTITERGGRAVPLSNIRSAFTYTPGIDRREVGWGAYGDREGKTRMVGGHGNIWQTTPLIKPKERHVLSFRARRYCIVLCTRAARVGQLHRLYLECEGSRALARKFAPIPFHSPARRGPDPCVAAETGKTDGRNEIFRSDCTLRRRDACCSSSRNAYFSLSLSCSPFFLDRNIRFLYRILSSRISSLGVVSRY